MFKVFIKSWKSISFAVLILYLSLAKPATINDLNVFRATDKLAHYLVYVVFGIIITYDYWQMLKSTEIRNLRFFLWCIVLPIVFGGTIEIMQETWFKPRSAEWIDWLCDIAGILTGIGLMRFSQSRINLN